MTLCPTDTAFIQFREKLSLHDEISIVDKSGKLLTGIICKVKNEHIKFEHISSHTMWINKHSTNIFPSIRYKNPFNEFVSLNSAYFNIPLTVNTNNDRNNAYYQFIVTGTWKDSNELQLYKMENNKLYTQTLCSDKLNNMSIKLRTKLCRNLRSYTSIKTESELLFINIFNSEIFKWDLKNKIFNYERNKSLQKLNKKSLSLSCIPHKLQKHSSNTKTFCCLNNNNIGCWSFIDDKNNIHILRSIKTMNTLQHIKFNIKYNQFIGLGNIKSDNKHSINLFQKHYHNNLIYNGNLQMLFNIKLTKSRFKKRTCKICLMYIDDMNIKTHKNRKWKYINKNTELPNKNWNEKSFRFIIVYDQILIIELSNIILFIDLFDNYKLYKTNKFIKDNHSINDLKYSQIINRFNDYIHVINYKKEYCFKLFIKDILPQSLYHTNKNKINSLINAYCHKMEYEYNLFLPFSSCLENLIFNYYPLFIQC